MRLDQMSLMLGGDRVKALHAGDTQLWRQKLSALVDGFDNGSAWLIQNPAVTRFVNGRVELDVTAAWDGNIYSLETFDLTNSSAIIEVIQTAPQSSPTTYADTAIMFQADGGVDNGGTSFSLDIEKSGSNTAGTCTLYWVDAPGSSTTGPGFAYDPATMRWFRIRESGNTIYVDTSQDGLNWTQRLAWPIVAPVKATNLTLALGGGGDATYGTVIFDNLNVRPNPRVLGIPLTEELHESFDGDTTQLVRSPWREIGTIEHSNGTAVLTTEPSPWNGEMYQECQFLAGLDPRQLAYSSVTIGPFTPPDIPGTWTDLSLFNSADFPDWAEVTFEFKPTDTASFYATDAAISDYAFSKKLPGPWRGKTWWIRLSGPTPSTARCEVSSNGVDYTVVGEGSIGTPWLLDPNNGLLYISIYTYADLPNTDPYSMTIGGINAS